jgi:hypothetical protein
MRAVHAADAPVARQIWLVAEQSVVVREVPVASHTERTSPTQVRLPAAQVTVAHALRATKHIWPVGHAVVEPHLVPSTLQV